MFKVWLWMARNLGMFRSDSLFRPSGPLARVYYPPGPIDDKPGVSIPMAIGNAVEYAEIFGGEVVPVSFSLNGSGK